MSVSLRLSFGTNLTRVRLESHLDYIKSFRKLLDKYSTVEQINSQIAEVDLDELLANLIPLAEWPSHDTVHWDQSLRAVVTRASSEAAQAKSRLQAASTHRLQDEISPDLGPNWKADLAPFQQRDLEKLLRLGHGANFSVPGAGKTRVALALYSCAKTAAEVQRLLIVGPKSSYDAWSEENGKVFIEPPNLGIFEGQIPPNAEIVVINYERLDGAVSELISWLTAKPSMLILDEAHRMKLGPEGVYGSACLAMSPRAKRRLILTGTPAPNGVSDLANLMAFVWPGYGRQVVSEAIADGDLREASAALRPLYTRTTKSELDLPPQSIFMHRVVLPPLHREIYDAIVNRYSNRPGTPQEDLESLGRVVMYLLMAASSPALLAVGSTKYEPLIHRVPPLQVPEDAKLFDLLRDLPRYESSPKYVEAVRLAFENAKKGRKTLIWSTFIRSLFTLHGMLGELNPALVYGGTADRASEIDRFKNDPSCYVLLSNPATLGEGISLHHVCNDAIYVDRDFAAGKFLQSLDRIHRLGLPVDTITNVRVLISAGTIDEIVAERLGSKLDFMGRILDDPDVEKLADLDEEPPLPAGLDQCDVESVLGHLNAHTS